MTYISNILVFISFYIVCYLDFSTVIVCRLASALECAVSPSARGLSFIIVPCMQRPWQQSKRSRYLLYYRLMYTTHWTFASSSSDFADCD